MKRKLTLLLLSCITLASCNTNNPSIPTHTTLIPEVGDVRLLFNHGTAGVSQYYNYCPSIKVENDEMHIYYCTNQKEGNVTDYVGYRTSKIVDGVVQTSEMDFVLEHGVAGEWDSRHACDPSVVKGEFGFNGETYNYLMAYLGCVTSDSTYNEVGIAVSKTPNGPWVKCNFGSDNTKINPIVPVQDFTEAINCWGTGQPSLVSVDNKGTVLLFTTVGTDTATFTNLRKYDFSNINEYQLLDEQRTINTTGVRGTATGANFINNADFSYDTENQRVLMAKPRQQFGTDGKEPNFIADTIDVYYIDDTEREGVGEVLFAGNNTTKQWKLIGSVDQKLTGFLRNHNCGLITDAYGHLINTDSIGVGFTRSDVGAGNNWSYLSTYRIYATAFSFPKAYFPK